MVHKNCALQIIPAVRYVAHHLLGYVLSHNFSDYKVDRLITFN